MVHCHQLSAPALLQNKTLVPLLQDTEWTIAGRVKGWEVSIMSKKKKNKLTGVWQVWMMWNAVVHRAQRWWQMGAVDSNKNSPGIWSGCPNTSSAEDASRSTLGAKLSPSRTHSKRSNQQSSVSTLNWMETFRLKTLIVTDLEWKFFSFTVRYFS